MLTIKFVIIYLRREFEQDQKFDLQKIPTTNIMGLYHPNSRQYKDKKWFVDPYSSEYLIS